MTIPFHPSRSLSPPPGVDRALFGSVGLLLVLLVQGVTAYSGHIGSLVH